MMCVNVKVYEDRLLLLFGELFMVACTVVRHLGEGQLTESGVSV